MAFTTRRMKMRSSQHIKNLLVLGLGFIVGSLMYITMDQASKMSSHIREGPGGLRLLLGAFSMDSGSADIHRKPSTMGGITRTGIPRIIHQTWHEDDLPPRLQQWTRVWRSNHINWDYFFWTRNGGTILISKKFPKLMSTYEQYPSEFHRSNMHKYALMYAYGGIFVNADIENMRRVDRLLDQYPCILSLEPQEHHILLRERNMSEIMVVNSIMACKPRHKFFEVVLNLLPQYLAYTKYDSLSLKTVSQSTGTHFLSQALDIYNTVYNTPENKDTIHILPSGWLMPTYDKTFENFFWLKCTTNYMSLPFDQRKSCIRLVKRNFENTPMNYSFAYPHWFNTDEQDRVKLSELMAKNGFQDNIQTTVTGNAIHPTFATQVPFTEKRSDRYLNEIEKPVSTNISNLFENPSVSYEIERNTFSSSKISGPYKKGNISDFIPKKKKPWRESFIFNTQQGIKKKALELNKSASNTLTDKRLSVFKDPLSVGLNVGNSQQREAAVALLEGGGSDLKPASDNFNDDEEYETSKKGDEAFPKKDEEEEFQEKHEEQEGTEEKEVEPNEGKGITYNEQSDQMLHQAKPHPVFDNGNNFVQINRVRAGGL